MSRYSFACLIFLLPICTVRADSPDWKQLVQQPHENLPVADIGLQLLLVNADGKPITAKAEWDKARKHLMERWLAQLGKAPEAAPKLDVRIEETAKQDGYTRQLLSFASEGDDRIRAYLLVPDAIQDGERRPAVVVFHQTSRDTLKEPVGLGSKPELAIAVHLVKRGYIALCPECYILKDPKGWARGQAEALQKRRPGWTGMGKMTFDASRSVDFLESLPNVDPKRIGCIGHSLGAKEVLYAMALEPRYKAGVFSEGGIGLRMSNWTDEWYLTARIKERIPEMEHHQVLALIAPRPILIVGGDEADGDASWTFVKAALPVYELLGTPDHIGLYNHRKKHTFPKDARRIACRWLDHWLDFEPVADEVGEK